MQDYLVTFRKFSLRFSIWMIDFCRSFIFCRMLFALSACTLDSRSYFNWQFASLWSITVIGCQSPLQINTLLSSYCFFFVFFYDCAVWVKWLFGKSAWIIYFTLTWRRGNDSLTAVWISIRSCFKLNCLLYSDFTTWTHGWVACSIKDGLRLANRIDLCNARIDGSRTEI